MQMSGHTVDTIPGKTRSDAARGAVSGKEGNKRRQPRNEPPDLRAVASSTECTGALPAQLPENMTGDETLD